MKLHPVELERLTPEILHVFGRQPPLLTAGDKTGLNTMTIGWCQLGRLWNLPVSAQSTCGPSAIPINLWSPTIISPSPSCRRRQKK